ncbi:MAG: AbrB/MazE/SpoVT family DNA-binding domain-containing protein [Desulfobulbaceae bacterium]|nr:MAG: AbrB/MazE/SpoVT family DNA-binding domain-containing protein [Desulfobulbaceae bacterium]
MKSSIIRIGNSQGLRIPKPILDQCGFEGEVELIVKDHDLIVRSAKTPRAGWDEAFQKMAEKGDDKLFETDSLIPTKWDEEEWEWK